MSAILEFVIFLEALIRGTTTWALLIAILIIAALVGWTLHRLQKYFVSHVLRLLSIGVALVAMIVSGWLMNLRTLSVPATDRSMFDERASYLLEFNTQVDQAEASYASVRIALPNAVRINRDAAIDLSVFPKAPTFGTQDRERTSTKNTSALRSKTSGTRRSRASLVCQGRSVRDRSAHQMDCPVREGW